MVQASNIMHSLRKFCSILLNHRSKQWLGTTGDSFNDMSISSLSHFMVQHPFKTNNRFSTAKHGRNIIHIGTNAEVCLSRLPVKATHLFVVRFSVLSELPSCRKLPTFLYVMPFSKTRIFLEETSLVARPAIQFDELKERLKVRMAHLGIKVRPLYIVLIFHSQSRTPPVQSKCSVLW